MLTETLNQLIRDYKTKNIAPSDLEDLISVLIQRHEDEPINPDEVKDLVKELSSDLDEVMSTLRKLKQEMNLDD